MKQPDELTAAEAAALLGYKTRESVIKLWRTGHIAGREERVGVLGRTRIYLRREDVEALRAKIEGPGGR